VASQVQPGFLSKLIPDHAPEDGEPWDLISSDYQSKIMPGITHWQSPNFYAYYPGNATFEGGLADLHAAMISNPGFNWACSPSVTELDIITLDWAARMLGFSEDFLSTSSSGKGGGIILGSASEVAVTVAIGARERALSLMAEKYPAPPATNGEGAKAATNSAAQNGNHATSVAQNGTHATSAAHLPEDDQSQLDSDAAVAAEDSASHQAAVAGENATLKAASALAQWRGELTSRLVMYGTTQTHSIGAKAALILGLDFRALEVTAEDGFGLRGATLEAALREDEAAGRVPFMLVCSLGTTSSAATDNLDEIVEVAKTRPTLFLHVDAAYAGVALALPEVREKCYPKALQQVDSFSTNYHKVRHGPMAKEQRDNQSAGTDLHSFRTTTVGPRSIRLLSTFDPRSYGTLQCADPHA
jgi:aromatic-L-amino-acid decarboxylase